MATILSILFAFLGLAVAILVVISLFEQKKRLIEISRSFILMILLTGLVSMRIEYLDMGGINNQLKEQNYDMVKKLEILKQENRELKIAREETEKQRIGLEEETKRLAEIEKLGLKERNNLKKREEKIGNLLIRLGISPEDLNKPIDQLAQIE